MATSRLQTNLDAEGVSRVLNLPNAVDPQEPATKAQLDAAVEGTNWKDEVRVSTQANLSLASPGATIDGITMVALDRVLVRVQTADEENGIYLWNGSAVAMTRAPDADSIADLRQAVVSVTEGTDASTTWRQTAVGGTLGTDPITFAAFGTAAPAASETTAGISELASQAEVDGNTGGNRVVTSDVLNGWSGNIGRFNATFGDGSNTTYTITHNLGTRDVVVDIYETASPYGRVFAQVDATTINAIDVTLNTAPASNSLRAVIRS